MNEPISDWQGAVIRDGQSMHLPNLDATVAFVETPDDSETTRHVNSAAPAIYATVTPKFYACNVTVTVILFCHGIR